VIKMDLSEYKEEDIDISLEDSCLTISGKHEREEETEDKNYYRKECYSGSFSRRIQLPKEVKEEDVSAGLKEGVLEVRVKGAGTAIEGKKKIPIASS